MRKSSPRIRPARARSRREISLWTCSPRSFIPVKFSRRSALRRAGRNPARLTRSCTNQPRASPSLEWRQMCFWARAAKPSNRLPSESRVCPPRRFARKPSNVLSAANTSLRKSSRMLRATAQREWNRFLIYTPRGSIAAKWLACLREERWRAQLRRQEAVRETRRHSQLARSACRSLVAPNGPVAAFAIASWLRTARTRRPGALQGHSEIRYRSDLRKVCWYAGICAQTAAEFADSENRWQRLAGIRQRRRPHRAHRKGRRYRDRVYGRGAGRWL